MAIQIHQRLPFFDSKNVGSKLVLSAFKEKSNEGIILPESEKQIITQRVGFEEWFPYAASHHNLSTNLSDYFFTSTAIIYSELPNRNGISFPTAALLEWNPDKGCCAYQGWKGCPVYHEHDWGDEQTGRKPGVYGIIVDVALRHMKGYGNGNIYKVVILMAIDRTSDPSVVGPIESGERNSYSMGCTVERYTCSYCGAELGHCSHLNPDKPVDFYELNGKLVYREVWGVKAVETSSVSDPAYFSALGEVRFKYKS